MIFTATPSAAAGLIRDAEIEATLAKLSAPIFQASGLASGGVDIYILNDNTLNAFVFGGRNMVFHTGLLKRLERPEELMAVMAHEAGHITGGHLVRRDLKIQSLQGPLILGMLLSAAAGVASGSAEVGAAGFLGTQSALQRSYLAYSRGEESAADQSAVSYLEKSGIDPEAMLEVLKIFRGQEVFQAGNVDPYAITHPLSQERIALIEDRAARTGQKGAGASPELAYWHERMRAKLSAFTDRPERTLSRLEETSDPQSEMNTLRRAVAMHLLPDPGGALNAVDNLIAMRPDDPYYYELKGQILFESGRAGDAVAPLRKAVALAPHSDLIRGALGRALLALGDPAQDAEALEALEKASRGMGAEPSVLRDLALAYARSGNEAMAALATAERFALVGQPEDAYRHARRASDMLPNGSPGWIRAEDILMVAEQALRKD